MSLLKYTIYLEKKNFKQMTSIQFPLLLSITKEVERATDRIYNSYIF